MAPSGLQRRAALDDHPSAVAPPALDGALILAPDQAGPHLVARMTTALAGRAAAAGIATFALSAYAIKTRCDPFLPLGYAAVPEDQIEDGVRALGSALEI